MISKDKASKLVLIYLYISDIYDKELKFHCQRFSNNAKPKFTDIEILTTYLFVVSEQRYTQVKEVYNFIKDYWLDWFPDLPTYQAYNARLNNLVPVWQHLLEHLFVRFIPEDCDLNISLVDSFPIVTCKGRNRIAKVAREITDKGYCSTKNMHYYGLKLHNLGFRRKGTIPFPEMLAFSPASANDYKIFVQEFDPYLVNRMVFADKIYINNELFTQREQSQNYQILTPVKLVKGEPDCIRQREKAANDLYSTAVSTIREPIESFFNWLNEKVKIQNAQKVRSTAGLLVHIFAKMAAAFIYLVF